MLEERRARAWARRTSGGLWTTQKKAAGREGEIQGARACLFFLIFLSRAIFSCIELRFFDVASSASAAWTCGQLQVMLHRVQGRRHALSDICSGFCAGATVGVESSHPFQAPPLPSSHRVLRRHRDVTGGAAVAQC